MTESVRLSGIARWIVPVLTVLVTTGSLVVLLAAPDDGDFGMALVALLFLGGPSLGIAAVVQAVAMSVRTSPGALPFFRRAMLLVKLGLVPLYLFGALLVLFAGLMAVHPVLAAALPLFTIAGPLVTYGWVMVALCSAWTLAYAVGLWRAGGIGAGECAAYCVLSFFFVADVVCAVVLFARGRPRERVAAAAAPQVQVVAWRP